MLFQGASNTGNLGKKAFGQLNWQLIIAPGSTVKIWLAVGRLLDIAYGLWLSIISRNPAWMVLVPLK